MKTKTKKTPKGHNPPPDKFDAKFPGLAAKARGEHVRTGLAEWADWAGGQGIFLRRAAQKTKHFLELRLVREGEVVHDGRGNVVLVVKNNDGSVRVDNKGKREEWAPSMTVELVPDRAPKPPAVPAPQPNEKPPTPGKAPAVRSGGVSPPKAGIPPGKPEPAPQAKLGAEKPAPAAGGRNGTGIPVESTGSRWKLWGLPVTAVLRWCGADAWTQSEVRTLLAALGIPEVKDATIKAQLQSGAKGDAGSHGPIPYLRPAQEDLLRAAASPKPETKKGK